MKKLITLALGFVLCSYVAYPQGCISVRSIVGFGQFVLPQSGEEPVKWVINVNTRYFTSWKTFYGKTLIPQEPYQRATNHIFVTDIAFTRMFNNGWSLGFDIPYTSASRTSVKEHDGRDPANPEYTTHAVGLSDIRVAVYKWMWDVTASHKGNIQLGFGVKLPNGSSHSEDYFHKDANDPGKTVVAPVNISTQLGDGGTGFTFEMNSFYTLTKNMSLYGNFFYLISPKDQNGVSNLMGGVPSVAGHPEIPTSVIIGAGGLVNSVPDGYTARAGANYTANKFIFSAGLRMEGAPVHDLIGSSNGLRRAGYIVSVEPGVNYSIKNSVIFAYVPFQVAHMSKQIVPDQRISQATGVTDVSVQSPGGFADYMIFVGVYFKIF